MVATASRAARWLAPPSVVAFAVTASIAVRSLTERLSDPDLWWHLRTGELIASSRSIPTADPYSYTATGRSWTVQEWGAELFLHALREAFGLWGIIGYRTALLVAIYLVLARIIRRHLGHTMGAWALIALAAYAGAPNWTERPNLLSFLLFAVTLDLLDRRDRRAVGWFVPIALVWANLHGMVLIGLGLVFVVAVGETARAARSTVEADRAWATRLWQVLGLALLATMLNPRGPGLYVHAFGLLETVGDVVTEWASPDFHQAGTWAFLALLFVTVGVLIARGRDADPTDLLLAAAFVFLALQARRNLAVAGIVLGVVVARTLPALRRPDREPAAARPPSIAVGAAAIVAVSIAMAAIMADGLPASNADEDLIDSEYAIEAIDALARPGVRVFAYDFWGPMIIDRAWPAALVYFDLRSDMYGIEHVRRYQQTISALPGWETNLDRDCTTHVLIQERHPLNQVLALDPEWLVERSDERSVTWVRALPARGCESTPIPRA